MLLHAGQSAIAGGVGAMVVGALRYFTVAYLGSTRGAAGFGTLSGDTRAFRVRRRIAFRRARNAVLAGVIIVAVVLPIIYLSKDIIYSH